MINLLEIIMITIKKTIVIIVNNNHIIKKLKTKIIRINLNLKQNMFQRTKSLLPIKVWAKRDKIIIRKLNKTIIHKFMIIKLTITIIIKKIEL